MTSGYFPQADPLISSRALHDALTYMPAAISILRGENLAVEYMNPLAHSLLGNRAVIGRPIREALPELEGQAVLDIAQQVYRTGEPFEGREVPIRWDRLGTGVVAEDFFNVAYVPLRDDSGSIGGVLSFAVEVTPEVRARRAVELAEQRYRSLVAATGQIVWTNSPDGRMLGEQHDWGSFTGQTRAEYEGFGWASAVHPDDAQPTVEAWNQAVAERRMFVFEHRVRRHDGVYRLFAIRAVPMLDDDGTIREWVGLHTDITDQRAAELRAREEQLALARAEAHEAVLRERAAELERSNQELQAFAYVASHDLQEPLRKIQAFGDRLASRHRDALGEQGVDYVTRIQSAAGRMQTLINDLLTYSRVATKAQPFKPVELDATVRDVLTDLEVRIADTGATVTVDPLPTIDADPLQMRQLMQNLLGNALKFRTPDTPPVIHVHGEVVTQGGGRFCRLTVRDNGIGFDEKYLDRVFGIFQRLHGRSEYEGTGVGLAIVRRIAERHGGTVTARSVPGQGATFIVTLPVSHPEGSNPSAGTPRAESVPGSPV